MTETAKLEEIRWGSQSPNGQVLLSLAWELFVMGAAILSIVNLVLLILIQNEDISQVVVLMDLILILIFVIDLFRRLNVATDNRAYFVHGWGWLDLISIVPALRIARVLRISKVLRITGQLGGIKVALRIFFRDRATGGLLIVLFVAIVVMEFGSLAILAVERGAPGANIETASDAVWYTLVTMSTVGYGDQYPVTQPGRIIGSGIIIVGVGVFGTLTGFLANAFISPSSSKGDDEEATAAA
jgi:voltage-gated potassium channel